MSNIRKLGRVAALCSLSLAAGGALADGSGTINDAALSLEYTSGAFVIPNMTPFAGDPVPVVCEPGTPTCDLYTVKVELSDAFRAENPNAFLDVEMSWGGTPVSTPAATFPDFDMYFLDSAGGVIQTAATAANPEFISLPLDVLPNGSYTAEAIPFMPMGEAFTLKIKVTGLEESKSGGLSSILGGALNLGLLLPLGLLAGFRRRR